MPIYKEIPDVVSPIDIINRVLYGNLAAIFGYRCFSEPDILYSSIKRWSSHDETDGRCSCLFKELELRPDTGMLALGYCDGGSNKRPNAFQFRHGVGIIVPSFGLPYFSSTILGSPPETGKFLFNVGAMSYDRATGSIINDYITALRFASTHGLCVVIPISIDEVSRTTALAIVLTRFYSNNSHIMHLFDGVNFCSTLLPDKAMLNLKNEELELRSVIESISATLSKGATLNEIIDRFNELTGWNLDNFHYSGNSTNPEIVFVTCGPLESSIFNSLIREEKTSNSGDCRGLTAGVISVRIPLPFDTKKFVSLLPKSTRKLVVVSQCSTADTTNGSSDSFLVPFISAALFYNGLKGISIKSYNYEPDFAWSEDAAKKVIESIIPHFFTLSSQVGERDNTRDFILWVANKEEKFLASLIQTLCSALNSIEDDGYKDPYYIARNKIADMVNCEIFQCQFRMRYGSRKYYQETSLPSYLIPSEITEADCSIVQNISILSHVDVVSTIREGGVLCIVVSTRNFEKESVNDVEYLVKMLGIPFGTLDRLIQKKLDLTLLYAEDSDGGERDSELIQYAFRHVALNYSDKSVPGSSLECETSPKSGSITHINIPYNSLLVGKTTFGRDGPTPLQLPSFIHATTFVPHNFSGAAPDPTTQIIQKSTLDQLLCFKEKYSVSKELRPDITAKTYPIRVKFKRRVTPVDYNRSIFEITFDTSETGMQYNIGDALGIYARNNEISVFNFLVNRYGAESPKTLLVTQHKKDTSLREVRTALQMFTECLDIFGKPNRQFYERLLPYVTDPNEVRKLKELLSPQGIADIRYNEKVECYTYIDILDIFSSAKPPLSDLVSMIPPLKRREYSIASSQKLHPNEIKILVHLVEWTDNQGRKRYGRASKYLADLETGDITMVSIISSVMKLPPLTSQPLIMCGLGTGLAPFRALVEEKYWQKMQGEHIGDIYLFVGSRHRREEYLFGEVWEAYRKAGIITHLGTAFSRDQDRKIYVQDSMMEIADKLRAALFDENGVFYLCGPTWPVPDVTRALKCIIELDAKNKGKRVNSSAVIDDMKENSKFLLEVY